MNNAVYRTLASFCIKALALVLCLVASMFFFTVYALEHVWVLYYFSVGFIALIVFLVFSLWIDYRTIREVDWAGNSEDKLLHLSLRANEETLKLCEFWVNGATYEKLAEDFKLGNNTGVSRELKKGVRQLLKEHGGKQVTV